MFLIRAIASLTTFGLLVACQTTVGPAAPLQPAASIRPVEPLPVAECRQGASDWVWAAPAMVRPGEPLSLIAVSTAGAFDSLYLTDPTGRRAPFPAESLGGPPWGLVGQLNRSEPGVYRVEAARGGRVVACGEIDTIAASADRGSGDWDLANQALYAVWIEHLFDAPAAQSLSFDSLAPVLRDPGRNLLYDYLGAGEDARLPAEPDCADLPYFMRAYFAWKRGLPVAYRSCSRGGRNNPPSCAAPVIETGLTGAAAPQGEFRSLSRRIMDSVHSGCGRTALADEATDFYPVPLSRSALWPGTVFADPYGHTLILVKWVPQTAGRGGMLLAADAQPDNSVTRKRFWEGTFLFAQTPSAGAGFKAYRPLVGDGAPRPMTNQELAAVDGIPPYSAEQSGLDPDDFYARMERLINPAGLDPETAYESTLEALMEQLETRVSSVARGEAYMHAHPSPPMPMPSGPAIFETTGPWEDYATPSRDMRLLIAMNVLEGLPNRIRRYPDLYRLGGRSPAAAAADLEQLGQRRASERFITYTRSDGSPWRLSLAEIYQRRTGLQTGYNPNDCVELRWGAAPGSAEYAPCRRQAPGGQRQRMEQYRPWFAETRRPPR